MPKRRGGQNSAKARKGTAEPDAEHSGSEDEPLGEPPLVAPCTRLLEAETQTACTAPFQRLDADTQTPGQAGSVWELVHSIPGYHPRNDQDRVMFSRAAMHEHQILVQCAQCKAGTLTDVLTVVALCAPLPCQRCGYTLMRPADQSDKATARHSASERS